MPCTRPPRRRLAEAAVRRALSLCVAGALLILAAACSDRAPPAPTGPEGPSLAKSSCTLGVPDATALSTIADLVAAVNALEAAGSLTAGQANALRQHLESARQAILAQDYCTALTKLRTFREQAGNFVKDGTLTAEEGETLTGGARDVLEGPIASIDAGRTHSCAVTTTGRGYCWGENLVGELGDGTTTQRPAPVPVGASLGLRFAAIDAGFHFTCGVTIAGAVYCWGKNEVGQLGDGTTTPHWSPVQVGPGLGLQFASVTSGWQHTCGLTTDGKVYCWGNNIFGQVGDGTTSLTVTTLPVAVKF